MRSSALLLLALASLAAAQTPETRRPNVIFFVSDDAGYADFSMHGGEGISTPRIDSLARDGVRFSQGYVSASVCSPSRAGLLTGRYQQRFGHELNIPPSYSEENGLPLDEVMLSEALRKAGMTTIALGKWHLGYAPQFHPLARGFDHYHGFLQGARSFFPLDEPTRLNELLRDREPVRERFDYLTDELGRQAAAYIEQHHDRPFFLYLAFNAVHTPMHSLESDLEGIPEELKPRRRKLIAMTHALDRAVGTVLDAVEAQGLSEHTLVVFVNDNGGATNNASDNGSLRGRKGSPFEGGIRVPFLMRWTGTLPAGQVYASPVSTLDLMPTALAACGVDSPGKPLDGVDLLPYVTGEREGRPHELLYWRQRDDWAVRQGDWKLVANDGEEPSLFDLATDPGEQQDLSAEAPEKLAELRQLYEAWSSELAEPRWRYTRGR